VYLRHRSIFLLLLSLAVAPAISAEPFPATLSPTTVVALSLHDIETLAVKRNREVQQANLEVSKMEAALRAVQTRRLPSINSLTFWGQQVDSGYKQNLASLPGVFEPVTQQYRIGMQIQQAKIDLSIARQKLRLAKQSAVAQVKTTYIRMAALKSAIVSREQNLAFLMTLQGYVESENKRGSALKVDVLSINSKRARAEFELERDRDEFITLTQILNRLLDRALNTPFEITQMQFVVHPEIESQFAIFQAKASRPELAQLKFDAVRLELERKIEKSLYMPDISIGGTAIFSRNLDITLPRTFASVGFLGIWEPWDWGRRFDLARVAERQRQKALVELDDMSDKVSIEVDNARRALKVVEKQVEAASLAETSAAEELRIANRRYQAGAAVLKDVTQAESEYSSAIAENVQAKSNYANAEVELDRTLGKDF
jgi:outer membrane protein TolC